ncbi:glycosyltransferase family 2 protein [Clostridium sp. YIM B02505]|uniref:Glycosyltransferase family 2 protein n=1 Tax=Clostridium yunnanense TaxID=2800325 RepID=A0ABS1EP90_9CLOT|nr:glycosyltransferase family 2 protein [Clostridium yunnanense]MBK1811209.1 glycosyltransferase family 2 protein [Clostridium yunnanense]
MVSIIMPTYNRCTSIEAAIQSVERQSYKDWELIIVDDCSSDDTSRIVERKMKVDERILYIRNSANMGPAATRNVGIYKARGEYLAFLDSDDEWMDYHLEESVSLLDNSDYQICSALWTEKKGDNCVNVAESDWFRESAKQMSSDLKVDISEKYWFFGNDFFEYIINTGFYCFHINTIVMDRRIVEKIGGFDEKLKASEDMDLLYRIFENYKLAFINREHFVYNFGNDNIYAFVERDRIYENRYKLDRKTKDKVLLNLKNKIEFFQKLDKRLKENKELYNNVKKSIKFNILRRYLTIFLLKSDNKDNKKERYVWNYASSLKDYLMILFYRNERYVNLYFCDD